MKNKINKKTKKIFLIVGIILLIAISGFLINKKITADAIREKMEAENYLSELSENCDCLTRERYYCLQEGFEVEGNYCIGQTTGVATMRILGCSEYNCSGEIKIWNNQSLKWEDKII
jgi:hypothetical protein